jgi:hypothetical protein
MRLFVACGRRIGVGLLARCALRGRRSLRDLYTPSAGALVGRDQMIWRSRNRRHEVTELRVGGPSGRTSVTKASMAALKMWGR